MSDNYLWFTFQGIINGVPTGMAKFLLPVLENIIKDKNKFTIYYLARVSEYSGDVNCKEIGKSFIFISRILSIIRRYLFSISSYRLRLFQELLFDYIASLKIHKSSILISTAYLLRATKKNKALGGINIFLAGNPDDYYIYNLLKKERKKYGVTFNDAYTYLKRINFVTESLNSYDHIVCQTITELESFNKRISNDFLSYIPSHIIPNLKVFAEKIIKKSNNLAFCYIAHTVWLKGLIYLLEAWETINYGASHLLIAGSINKDVEYYIKQHFSRIENVNFIGVVKDINKFYRQSHVCVIPSILDAGPATVVEAMYCGLPVIVSDGCGAKTLVKDGENGFIVPSCDSMAIYKKIEWFFKNQSVISAMGENAANTINELIKSDQNSLFADHILKVIDQVKMKNTR